MLGGNGRDKVIRIFVVSDVRLYRDGLANALESDGRLEMVGASARARSALDDATCDPAPDVVLLDMTVEDAFEAARRLSAREPPIKVVALGILERTRDIVRCAEAGVAGFCCRDQSLDDLVETVEQAACGELQCNARVAGALVRRVAKLAARQLPDPASARLTMRELEVVELINEGFSNKEIAARLCVQLATAKNHVHNILDKLGVHSRAQAATLVRRAGLLRRPTARLSHQRPS